MRQPLVRQDEGETTTHIDQFVMKREITLSRCQRHKNRRCINNNLPLLLIHLPLVLLLKRNIGQSSWARLRSVWKDSFLFLTLWAKGTSGAHYCAEDIRSPRSEWLVGWPTAEPLSAAGPWPTWLMEGSPHKHLTLTHAHVYGGEHWKVGLVWTHVLWPFTVYSWAHQSWVGYLIHPMCCAFLRECSSYWVEKKSQ